MSIFEWLGGHQVVWLYLLILAVFLGLANKTGNSGNDACTGYVNRGRKTKARLTIFVVLITGVLIVSLSQGFLGAFLDAGLAAKVYQATGDISQPLVRSAATARGDLRADMTALKWIGVVLFVVVMFVLVICSGADQVVGDIVTRDQ
jgi:hypothetical protein